MRTNLVILENASTQQQQLIQQQLQTQQLEQKESTTTKTTTITETHSANLEHNQSIMKSSNKQNNLNENISSLSTAVDGRKSRSPKPSKRTNISTRGSDAHISQQMQHINGIDGETGNIITTTIQAATNGYKDDGTVKIQAKGSANLQATKADSCSKKTHVTADGAAVTTVKSSKSSKVKYAVEASTVREEIIR